VLACKTFEVLDAGTFVPAVGILCEPLLMPTGNEILDATQADSYLLARAGYAHPSHDRHSRCVIFTRLDGHATNIAPYDPLEWGRNRTMGTAHAYVREHWDELQSGEVIDVEVILGLSKTPKTSERLSY
jgi:hypothetical protein